MARRYTTGFDILGLDGDPTPGDPDQTESLAKRYQAIADEAGVAVSVLRQGGTVDTGSGKTIDALKALLKDLPGKLQSTVDSFGEAAQVYRDWAGVMRDQQDEILAAA